MVSNLSNIFGAPVQGVTNLFTGNISLQASLYGTWNQSVDPMFAQDFVQSLAHEMFHRNLDFAGRVMSVPDNSFYQSIDDAAEAISRVVGPEFNRRMSQTCYR